MKLLSTPHQLHNNYICVDGINYAPNDDYTYALASLPSGTYVLRIEGHPAHRHLEFALAVECADGMAGVNKSLALNGGGKVIGAMWVEKALAATNAFGELLFEPTRQEQDCHV